MKTLKEIQLQCLHLSEARESVSCLVSDLNRRIAHMTAELLPAIKRAVQKAADRQAALKNLLEESPDLFVKPRTQTFHGVKCGYAKGKGAIEFEDEERVIRAIEKKLPDQFDTLVQRSEWVSKTALKNLSVKELESIGCTVQGTDDVPVIAFTDKEVDKLVKALLKTAIDEAQSEAA
jgi:hypothetical protein